MYNLKLPKDSEGKEFYEIELKHLDEITYIAVSHMVKADKEIEATKLLLKELHSGGDDINEVCSNFTAVHAAMRPALQILTPLEAELKKK